MADQMKKEDFAKMKVTELKKELKERGLSTTGTKSELFERLTADIPTPDLEPVLTPDDDSFDLNNSNIVTDEVKTEEKKEVVVTELETPQSETTDVTVEKEEPHPVKITVSPFTESDRLKKRAERFGVINEDIKKQSRAERFGLGSPATGSNGTGKLSTAGSGLPEVREYTKMQFHMMTLLDVLGKTAWADVDVLKKRAERFGQVVSSSLSKVDEEEKILKRKERFGDVTSSANNTVKSSADATTPPSKFAKITFGSADDDKKKKRAERFGLV